MRLVICCIVLASFLSACGGSGGGSTPAVGTPGSTGGGNSGGGGGAGTTTPSGTWQQEMLQSVNGYRTAGVTRGGTTHAAVGALVLNDRLTAAALAHATDMRDKNYFDHTGLDGSTPGTRVTAAGYAWSTVGENIANGQTSVTQVMNGWMDSDGHRRNIMLANYTEVGFARVGNYWVQVFGRPLTGVSQRTAPAEMEMRLARRD